MLVPTDDWTWVESKSINLFGSISLPTLVLNVDHELAIVSNLSIFGKFNVLLKIFRVQRRVRRIEDYLIAVSCQGILFTGIVSLHGV